MSRLVLSGGFRRNICYVIHRVPIRYQLIYDISFIPDI